MPKSQHHVAPLIRRSFIKALELRGDRTGKTLPEMMYDEIEEHGLLHVMEKVGKYVERQAHVSGTVEHKHAGRVEHVELSETARFFEAVAGSDTKGPPEKPVPH